MAAKCHRAVNHGVLHAAFIEDGRLMVWQNPEDADLVHPLGTEYSEQLDPDYAPIAREPYDGTQCTSDWWVERDR
jgi:hypothetical protein